jgi:drug/metabolite transporter (DMT)-like permease
VWREYKGKTLLWLIALAIFSTGIGSITWILSIEYLGAARAALINTTAPLTGVPLAVILLHERLTRRIALGVALSFVGVWLIL